MTCGACVFHIEQALVSIPGVESAVANLATEKATVEYVPDLVSINDLRSAITDSGYLINDGADNLQFSDDAEAKLIRWKILISLLVSAFLMIIMGLSSFYEVLNFDKGWIFLILATPVQIWCGSQFYSGAWNALKFRTSNMNTLVALSTSVAYFYSVFVVVFGHTEAFNLYETRTYFDTATMIIGLVLLGRYLELRSRRDSAQAISKLTRLQSKNATVIVNGTPEEIAVHEISINDVVLIRPGDIVPTDGICVDGESWIDESMLTGESFAVQKASGSALYGGTLNQTGSFTYKVTRVGQDTVLGEIIRIVEEAQGSKAPIQRLVDKIASYFVPAVIVVAFSSFCVWYFVGPAPGHLYGILSAVAVLIIACPCALGLATPMAMLVGIAKGARSGILIRNSESLELAHRVQVVALDKTGTVTTGQISIEDIVSDEMIEDDLLSLTATAESVSEHPIGKAVVNEARKRGLSIGDLTNFSGDPGFGIEANVEGSKILIGNRSLMSKHQLSVNKYEMRANRFESLGQTVAFVSKGDSVVGFIGVIDKVKPGAKDAITSLKELGADIVMLTGDSELPAKSIGSNLGISKIFANCSPTEKAEKILELQSQGNIVAMVGDGVNDAPALSNSDMSIAIGTGTDIATQVADVTLVNGDLSGVVRTFLLSKATLNKVKQNLIWAFGYNLFFIPIAAGALHPLFLDGNVHSVFNTFVGEYGFINPVFAAMAMAFSSLAVVFNSRRLINLDLDYSSKR